MKLKFTVHHGNLREEITTEGPDLEYLITSLYHTGLGRGYAITKDNKHWDRVLAELRTTGKTSFGWGWYELVNEGSQPTDFILKKEVAARLKKCSRTVDNLVAQGMPHYKIRRSVLYKWNEVEEWLIKNCKRG